jgi:hypothetical protein
MVREHGSQGVGESEKGSNFKKEKRKQERICNMLELRKVHWTWLGRAPWSNEDLCQG